MADMIDVVLASALVDGSSTEDPRVPGIISDINDIDARVDDLAASIAPVETGTTATRDYAAGDLLMFDDKLCFAGNAITSGTTLAIGTNIFTTTVYNQLNNSGIIISGGSNPTIVAKAGKQYVCSASYVESLYITPPSYGSFSVIFKSGTTPTILSLPSTVKMPEWWMGTEANRTYEISIANATYGVVTSWPT